MTFRQYQVTVDQLRLFRQAIANAEQVPCPATIDPRLRIVELAAMRSMARDLAAEARRYRNVAPRQRAGNYRYGGAEMDRYRHLLVYTNQKAVVWARCWINLGYGQMADDRSASRQANVRTPAGLHDAIRTLRVGLATLEASTIIDLPV